MPNILIADDHAVARRGIKEILEDAFPSSKIEAVKSAEEVLAKIIREHWDLVITDITMPGRSGLELLNDMKKEFPDIPVLILSVHPDEEYAIRCIKAGAYGYLNKDDAVEQELVKATSIILNGRRYITPSVAEKLVEELANENQKMPHEYLSDREFEVFRLMATGKTTGEIADQLSLSINTIGTFRSRILSKMNMKNNAEVVAYAVRNDLV